MKKRLAFGLILLTMLIVFTDVCASAQDRVILYPVGRSEQDRRYHYMLKLLQLILDKTADAYGAYKLKPDVHMNQERIIQRLCEGPLDVAQLPISEKAEKKLLPIRVPIRKGLLGWRLLIIRQDDRKAFAQSKSLADLKNFKAGFGHAWPDLPILESNVGKENVVTGRSYDGLFAMLVRGRFDYLHRGLHEPWAEVADRRSQFPNLWIEETLVLHYPIGDYLYVNQEDVALAERLTQGFVKAIEDGSFEALFQSEYGAMISKARIPERTLIKFANPFLPEETPLDDKRLWISF